MSIKKKEIEPVTFYTKSPAQFWLPALITKSGRRVELCFKKHKLRVTDAEEIKYVEKLKSEGKCGILTYDEFLEQTSPEDLFIEFNGKKIHRKEVERLMKLGIEHDVEGIKDITVIDDNENKIIQGTRGADTALK